MTRQTHPVIRIASTTVGAILRIYQLMISPIYGPVCRYVPSCSDYAREAVLAHGVMRGSCLAVRRLARCHPWGGSGFDPVPTARTHEHGPACAHETPLAAAKSGH